MKKDSYEKKINDILKLDQFEKLVKPRANSKDFIVKEEERIGNDLIKLQRDGEITEGGIEIAGRSTSKIIWTC